MPEILYGNREGRYFTQFYFDWLAILVKQLSDILPNATGWKIWYDRVQDFYHIAFEIGGDSYDVRYYKVFCVVKNGDDTVGGRRLFGRNMDSVVDYFRSKRHEGWECRFAIDSLRKPEP